mgnify:CR=1 FL=1
MRRLPAAGPPPQEPRSELQSHGAADSDGRGASLLERLDDDTKEIGYLTGLAENNTAKPYEHVWVLSYDGTFARIRLRGDAIYAAGIATTPDVYGITVTSSCAFLSNTRFTSSSPLLR